MQLKLTLEEFVKFALESIERKVGCVKMENYKVEFKKTDTEGDRVVCELPDFIEIDLK